MSVVETASNTSTWGGREERKCKLSWGHWDSIKKEYRVRKGSGGERGIWVKADTKMAEVLQQLLPTPEMFATVRLVSS